jgi:FkbM family methyltransferase
MGSMNVTYIQEKAAMKKAKKGAAFLLFKVSLAIENIYLLNRLIKFVGIRSYLGHLRNTFLRKINQTYFEADVYGIRIKLVDGSTKLEYYDLCVKGQTYEPPVLRMLKRLLTELDSPTFVDIGAHIGYFTIYAGNLMGKRGQIISIEPNYQYYKQLIQNIEINKLEAITRTFNIALSNKIGKANMGGFEDRAFVESEIGDIRVVTFDQLCETEKIKPDIIKIDVHGGEFKVLTGMSDTLKNHVKHLFVETHPPHIMQGSNIYDILRVFKNKNLEIFELANHRKESGGELVPIGDDFFKCHNDRMLYARRM